jgi:hypothetical protein
MGNNFLEANFIGSRLPAANSFLKGVKYVLGNKKERSC